MTRPQRRQRPTRTRTVKLEPIDAALMPLWYGYPEFFRNSIRKFLLVAAKWPAVRAGMPKRARALGNARYRRALFKAVRDAQRREEAEPNA